MPGVPIKALTGKIFLPQDELGIGQFVWDNTHPIIHRFGAGSGDVNPRYYPGIDKSGNLFLNYGTLIKSEYPGLSTDSGFGFEADSFIVRLHGITVFKTTTLGVQVIGGITQTAAATEFLPSSTGLSQLLFPLFNDKTLFAQFNRPAFAGIDASGNFKAHRDIAVFNSDFSNTFTRGGTADSGIVRYVNSFGNYTLALANQPRITYGIKSLKCLGLMIEPPATNLIVQSYNLTSWSANTGITFTQETNTVWATKGLNKPFSFIESSDAVEHSGTQGFTADATIPITLSFFYQPKNFTGIRKFTLFASNNDRTQLFGVDFTASASGAPYFSANRTVGNGNVSNYLVDDIGNGIFRIKITGTINSAGTSGASTLKATLASLGSNSSNQSLSFTPTANTGNWCLICDFQAEQSPFSTSYIQTVTTTLSRQADILSLNLANFRYSGLEGLFEYQFKADVYTQLGTVIFSLQDALGTTRLDFYIATIDSANGNYIIGTKAYQPSVTTVTNTNFATVAIVKSKLSISYTNFASNYTLAVISGTTGFKSTVSLLTYE